MKTEREYLLKKLVNAISQIFQKDKKWFYDESLEDDAIDPTPISNAVKGMPLEPGFLFSENLLQSAIPELLAQTGTTGRQFAHLLIRAHQESNQNRFPDIERAAETIGQKQFPLSLDNILLITKKLGMEIRWFNMTSFKDKGDADKPLNTLVRSFFDAPNIVYLNEELKKVPARLKFDLANHIGHMVLHGGDGARAHRKFQAEEHREEGTMQILLIWMLKMYYSLGVILSAVILLQRCTMSKNAI